MNVRINRVTAGVLLLLFAPVVLPIKLYRWVTGSRRKPTYLNTLEGDPLAFLDDRPVVVSLWASWASVWSAATADIVQRLQAEFSGRCEFVYVEATHRAIEEKYKVTVIPTVLVLHRGEEVGRFTNLTEADELRRCISERVRRT